MSERPPTRELVPLPLGLRLALLSAGWLLLLVGFAGLVLPGIQGVITILAGAALLSLSSEIAYRLLHGLFTPWPHLWRQFEAFRLRTHRRLLRWSHRRRKSGPGPPPADLR